MGIQACLPPWSHYGVHANLVPSRIWPCRMYCTHQPYKQIWVHPLPNGHPLWQLGEGQRHLKFKKKNKKPNVKLNILNEGYPLHDEGIA